MATTPQAEAASAQDATTPPRSPRAPWLPRSLAAIGGASVWLAGVAVLAGWGLLPGGWETVRWTQRVLHAHTVVALVAAVGLLVLSRPRGQAQMAPWASPMLLWVLGSVLLALVQQLGALPQWMAQSRSLGPQALVAVLWLLQALCASCTVHLLWRRPPAVATTATPA